MSESSKDEYAASWLACAGPRERATGRDCDICGRQNLLNAELEDGRAVDDLGNELGEDTGEEGRGGLVLGDAVGRDAMKERRWKWEVTRDQK